MPIQKSNTEVRNSYNTAISEVYHGQFKDIFIEIHAKKQSISYGIAKEASEAREQIKLTHQEETSFLGKIVIYARNAYKYGVKHCAGPDFDYLVAKGKTAEEIAYAAFKTDGSDLGLKNNGFGQILEIHAHLHKNNIVNFHPEDINLTDFTDHCGASKIAPACILEVGAHLVATCPNTSNIFEFDLYN